MLKEKVKSMNIANLNHLREGIISQCADIDGSVHFVHQNLGRYIELCIANNRNHIENIISYFYN